MGFDCAARDMLVSVGDVKESNQIRLSCTQIRGGIVACWANEREANLEKVGELCSEKGSERGWTKEGRSLAGGENLEVGIIR
jgi:hypothetical protein